jgi:ketosteroid isomerase-like protein
VFTSRRAVEHPTAALFEGWDKTARRYDATRRVAVVYEDFVVVVAMGLKQDGTLKANLVTCYQADNSIGKIRGSPAWSKTACLALLRGGP